MEEQVIYPSYKTRNWSDAWATPSFRLKAIGALIGLTILMIFLPYFYAFIEARQGLVLNDWVLSLLPARDCSLSIFIILWSTLSLILFRCIQQPAIFLRLVYLVILLTLLRICTLYLVPLDPPKELIILKDPLTSITYGGTGVFMTKDLFFSGHTANLFLVYLCLQKKRDKQFALLATMSVGFLVLVQHVHYFMDVLMAFVFTYSLFLATKRISFFSI